MEQEHWNLERSEKSFVFFRLFTIPASFTFDIVHMTFMFGSDEATMMTSWLQDPSLMAAILTTWLPFISFLLIIVFTRDHRRLSGGIAVAAVTGSLAGAVFLLVRHWGAD